jgi:hypothetical protein
MNIVTIGLQQTIQLLLRKLENACICAVSKRRRLVMKNNGEQRGQGVLVISMSENQCVWMKAGVVNFKICENAFDCTSCAFDKEINGKSTQELTSPVSWRQVMRQPHLHKECRHMLTGRVLFKLCSHNYECKDCAYDQFLYEYDQLLYEEDVSAYAAAQVNKVPGFMVPILDNNCAI